MSDTAEAPDDFTSFSQRRLSFNRDQSYIQFEVKLENDVNVEFDEIFKVKIVEPYVPDDEGGIVTIHVMDDDSKSLGDFLGPVSIGCSLVPCALVPL